MGIFFRAVQSLSQCLALFPNRPAFGEHQEEKTALGQILRNPRNLRIKQHRWLFALFALGIAVNAQAATSAYLLWGVGWFDSLQAAGEVGIASLPPSHPYYPAVAPVFASTAYNATYPPPERLAAENTYHGYSINGWFLAYIIYEFVCAPNYVLDDSKHDCVRPIKPCSEFGKGDPCDPTTGNEHHAVTDYRGSGPFPLTFTRTYNSMISSNGRMGSNWVSNFGDPTAANTLSLNVQLVPNFVQVPRPDGRTVTFKLLNGVWTPNSDITDTLSQTANGWNYTQRDGTVETYDNVATTAGNSIGRLISITNRAGLAHTLTRDPATGLLSAVTDPFGHSLSFTYDAKGRLSTMTDPDGGVTAYAYDDTNNANNLSSVTYPDLKVKRYTYNEPSYVTPWTNSPHALTGIFDENNNRYASFTYDMSGRVTTTQLADVGFGGPQEKFILNYGYYAGNYQTTVTDAAGNQEVLVYTTNLNVNNVTSKKSLVDNKTLTQTFDARNNLTCKQDEEGHVTTYGYNTSNQKISETQGQGGTCTTPTPTAATRTTTYQYLSPDLDLPTLIETPSVYAGSTKRVTIHYDANRNPDIITQSGYTPSGTAVTRAVTLGYNNGQVTSINGPRTDVADVTTLEYNNCTTGGGCGQLRRVTNALGHVTTYDNYDAHGRLLQMTDPNGVRTVYTYYPRGWVETVTETPASGTARMTRYTYTPAGQVETVTDPDGVVLRYQYDAAQQLRHVIDALGNDHAYAYDTRGNQNAESLYDASGTLTRTEGREFDARNHLYRVTRAGVVTTTVNDALGVLRSLTDGNNHTTNYSPDALNRIFTVTDALTKSTVTGYDVNDRVIAVKAPNDLTTRYSVDDLGNVLSEVSPDRGTITYTTDAAGNVRTRRADNGVTTTYDYDALNRLVSQQSSDASTPRYVYRYDSCTYGKGRLCRVDRNGAFDLLYGYDAFGRQTLEMSAFLAPYTVSSYTLAGRLQQISSPNGRTVDYRFDTAGQVSEVSTTANGVTTALARNISYYPFGPVKNLTYSNGLQLNQWLDSAYRPTLRFDGGFATFFESIGYDGADNITERWAPGQETYGYDVVNRLTAATNSQSYGTLGWSYDANGNRTSETRGTTNTPYTYLPAGSNWLNQTNSSDYHIQGAAGTTAFATSVGFMGYDGYERVATIGGPAGSISYGYDAFNKRVTKIQGGVTTRYHYGSNGLLLFESSGGNTVEYVYLNGIPLARIDNGSNIHTYHSDHLGTPQVLTNAQGQVVWAARYEPFGKATVTVQTVVNNLRFPGQYYDAESGLHYNWNRYYDPKLGRYITSDPIGLYAGTNTYAYVYNNPLRWNDPTGLSPVCIVSGGSIIGCSWDCYTMKQFGCVLQYSLCRGPDLKSDPSRPPPGGRPEPSGGDACLRAYQECSKAFEDCKDDCMNSKKGAK